MKTTKRNQNGNGNGKSTAHLHALLARVESAEKIFEAARSQWRLIKVEHKQARKAFKQARKAAKSARKEIKVAARTLRRKGLNLPKPLKPATLSKFLATRSKKPAPARAASSKRNGHSTTVLPQVTAQSAPTVPAVQLHA